jgi:hypothetical protein
MSSRNILLILALPCFCTTGCKSQEPAGTKSLNLIVQRDSIVDFHRFLEALKLLVWQQAIPMEIHIGSHDRRLSFTSLHGFPGEPLLIHVSPDHVSMGTGSSLTQLTLDDLHKKLAGFAAAASKAEAKGIVLLVSDRQVPGDFGLSILNTISAAGITTVMLSDPDLPEAPVPNPTRKPSSPSKREQAVERGE